MTRLDGEGLFGLPREVKESLIKKARGSRASPGARTGREGESADALVSFDEHPAARALELQRALAQAAGLNVPFYKVIEPRPEGGVRIDGVEVVDFSSYDYLGLNHDPRVVAAARQAVQELGTSVSASRLIGGERTVHGALESAIADMLGVEASVCFVSGVLTNMTAIATLVGSKDLVVHDALAHNSLLQGVRLSGAHRVAFPHNDWEALDRILTERRAAFERVIVALEGLYSMDGDVPDLPRFIEVKRRHRAMLMVDEAHSIGVLGRTGRGLGEHFGIDASDVDIWMGTLSKTLAGCGGYIAGSRALVEILRFSAPGLVFSVGLSPALAAASLEAIRVMLDEPVRVERLAERSRLFHRLAGEQGIPVGNAAGHAIVPVILGDSRRTLRLTSLLLERGIHVPPAIPPGVEPARSRLRFFLNATHSEEQVRRTVEVLAAALGEVG